MKENTCSDTGYLPAFVYPVLVVLVMGLGLGLRLYRFPHIPPGLNIDEAISAYEAFSLLETGRDKWGHPWPAYFPGWGSGQNVLQAYLTIPFVHLLGLNVYAARLPALLPALLTLPLFFVTLRPLGRFTALLGLLLLSVAPWHFMLSRWALESNLLPFCMLLGCFTFSRALHSGQKRWIVPSLLPFAGALYAYGTTILVLPPLLAALGLLFYRRLLACWPAWLGAAVLFLLAAFPFLIFFAENYLLKANMAWTDGLFFTTALLPANRLDQVNNGSWADLLYVNREFVLAGFNDHTSYNVLPGFGLLPFLTPPLLALGWLAGAVLVLRDRFRLAAFPAHPVVAVFVCWAAASCLLLLVLELNINRFNHFFLPALALAAWGAGRLLRWLPAPRLRRGGQVLLLAGLLAESAGAIRHYFTQYPRSEISLSFNAGLEPAYQAVAKLPVSQVRLPAKVLFMPIQYTYALFYLQYPPAAFQQSGDFSLVGGRYEVRRFGRYLFDDALLDRSQPFGYLRRKSEAPDYGKGSREVIFENQAWEVGIIRPLS
ncbi:MAG: glycosyltransferase family 39 protein, partial [Adhaeribacter sp.]